MSAPLRGFTALVTGGATGIGRGIAEALAKHGAAVALASRNLENLQAAAREIGESTTRRCLPIVADVRQPEAVAAAIEKASAARAFGADYVANIVRQQQAPRRPQPPLKLRDPHLNELVTDPVSLLAYDAFILDSGKEDHDRSRTETAGAEPTRDESPSGADHC